MLHAYFIQDMEGRFGYAASGEHGALMRYTPHAIAAQDAIMAAANRVEYQNGPDGPRCQPEQAHIRKLFDVFCYPRKWGLAPSPDACIAAPTPSPEFQTDTLPTTWVTKP